MTNTLKETEQKIFVFSVSLYDVVSYIKNGGNNEDTISLPGFSRDLLEF